MNSVDDIGPGETPESPDNPLSGETVKRVYEMFGQALGRAMSAGQDDKADLLRRLSKDVRAAAVAHEGESEMARALHQTADRIDDALLP